MIARRENRATREDLLSLRQLFQSKVEMVPDWKQGKARCGAGLDWSVGTLTAGFVFIRIWLSWGKRGVESTLIKHSDDYI